MKISVIGAGNVGGMTALRLIQEGAGEVLLIDVAKGLAEGKALDLEDSCALNKYNRTIKGGVHINQIKDSGVVIVTAGLTRKPGMDREELIQKNAAILSSICSKIKDLCPNAIVIIVSNPVDILTYLAFKKLDFPKNRVMGCGLNLDAGRFSNLISKELQVANSDIDPMVIGAHGQTMLPLERFTYIKGVALSKLLDEARIAELIKSTVERGANIVSLLGSGSAYFAPSAAILGLVKTIIKDEKKNICVSTYLQGEYGLNDLCIGVPCRLGKRGIEKIIELDLDDREQNALRISADTINKQKQALNELL